MAWKPGFTRHCLRTRLHQTAWSQAIPDIAWSQALPGMAIPDMTMPDIACRQGLAPDNSRYGLESGYNILGLETRIYQALLGTRLHQTWLGNQAMPDNPWHQAITELEPGKTRYSLKPCYTTGPYGTIWDHT